LGNGKEERKKRWVGRSGKGGDLSIKQLMPGGGGAHHITAQGKKNEARGLKGEVRGQKSNEETL